MELTVLDKDKNLFGDPISSFRSLIWTQRWTEPGEFQLYTWLPYFATLNAGAYIYSPELEELGKIEKVIKQKASGLVAVSGRFSEVEYNSRCVHTVQNLTGAREDVALSLLGKFCCYGTSENPVQCRPVLGASGKRGESVSAQVTGDYVGDYVYALLNADGLSLRNVYDFSANTMRVEAWAGKDRRSSQTVNPLCVLGGDEENVTPGDYSRSRKDFKNFAYVAGEGEGVNRKIITVDRSGGDERLELWVDANDIQSEVDGKTLTTAELEALMVQRGNEKLDEYQNTESVDTNMESVSNLTYGIDADFYLGDLAEYHDTVGDFDLTVEGRITKVVRTWEDKKMSIQLFIGDEEKKIMQKVKREANK